MALGGWGWSATGLRWVGQCVGACIEVLLWGDLPSCTDLMKPRSKSEPLEIYFGVFFGEGFNYELNLFGKYRNVLNSY